jgi:hypothetical protein
VGKTGQSGRDQISFWSLIGFKQNKKTRPCDQGRVFYSPSVLSLDDQFLGFVYIIVDDDRVEINTTL